MITNIPLNKLRLSDRNVRKTNREEGVEMLSEDIASRGLKQNLVVTHSKEKKGHYEVDAGGRRYLALKRLADAKRIPANTPIPCLVEDWNEAHETSLAENLHRVAMNPADEFEAFATVLESYTDAGISDRTERIANCAHRFGVSIRHVEQRLRLAELHPAILDALRDGRITVGAAKAYAAHPDHELQLKIFENEEKKPASWRHEVQAIRNAMDGKVYQTDHRAVLYVGLDAYAEAGGRIEPDLFLGDEERDALLDPAIIDKLARDKAGEEADQLAKQAGWSGGIVVPINAPGYAEPRPPKGFARKWDPIERVSKKVRKTGILAYRIANEGTGLEQIGAYYLPVDEEAENDKPVHQPMSDEEFAAHRRRRQIEFRAARMAAPKVAGTPLEGRAFWPVDHRMLVDALERREDGSVLIAMQIAIPAEEVEAMLGEAEKALDREEEELREEEEALAAEAARETEDPDAGDEDPGADLPGPDDGEEAADADAEEKVEA